MKQNFLKKFCHKENPKDFLCPKILKGFFGNKDFKMNKKAKDILTSELLTIVIAIICIGFLIYFSVNLFGIFSGKNDIEKAKESLSQIKIMINGLEEGKNKTFLVTTPSDWYIMVFNQGQQMPSSCANSKSCMCICSVQSPEGCDKKGVCQIFDKEMKMSYSCIASLDFTNAYGCFKIKLDKLPISRANGIIFIGNEKPFTISKNLEEVLKYVDAETGKNIDTLLGEYVAFRDNALKTKIEGIMIDYVKTNVNDVSSWYLTITLESETRGVFGYYPTSGEDMSEIPSFRNIYEEIKEYAGKKYSFKWEFNLKSG